MLGVMKASSIPGHSTTGRQVNSKLNIKVKKRNLSRKSICCYPSNFVIALFQQLFDLGKWKACVSNRHRWIAESGRAQVLCNQEGVVFGVYAAAARDTRNGKGNVQEIIPMQ